MWNEFVHHNECSLFAVIGHAPSKACLCLLPKLLSFYSVLSFCLLFHKKIWTALLNWTKDPSSPAFSFQQQPARFLSLKSEFFSIILAAAFIVETLDNIFIVCSTSTSNTFFPPVTKIRVVAQLLNICNWQDAVQAELANIISLFSCI